MKTLTSQNFAPASSINTKKLKKKRKKLKGFPVDFVEFQPKNHAYNYRISTTATTHSVENAHKMGLNGTRV